MIWHGDNMNGLKGIFSHDNGFTQLTIALFVAFSSLIALFGLECVALWIIYKPASLESFNALITGDIALLKLSQALQAFALFIFPAFITAFLLTKTTVSDYLSLKNKANITVYMLVALAAIFALPSVNALAELNNAITFPPFLHGFEVWARSLEDAAQELTEKFLSVSGIPGLLLNIFVVAVLAAVGEELIFRGVLQRIFTNWTKSETLGIWLTAFVFSVVHFQFFGFLPRLLLGAFFGYLLVWTRTIWLPTLAHFIHNGVSVVAFYLHHNGYIQANPDEVGTSGMLWLSAVTTVLFLGIVYWIQHASLAALSDRSQH